MKTWHWLAIAAAVALVIFFVMRTKTTTVVPQHVTAANLALPIGAVTVPPNNPIAISGRMHF
jgi:hypothetical protein